ncbi:MAG: hypothetical protein A3F67_05880 [Verrucomicrobia bacterium RIFCSPHIGHO2_12_FULL_41_10]|nr:MAG: hypothetical protein A3F67_05880 [Verrucomicrobia bacterium RIFCSPHIGHO2_12_FULL_41_10]HLB33439.1 hypothetical protein [Chthoniobacterales bacterium]
MKIKSLLLGFFFLSSLTALLALPPMIEEYEDAIISKTKNLSLDSSSRAKDVVVPGLKESSSSCHLKTQEPLISSLGSIKISEEEGVDISEELSTNEYLTKEICDNIYAVCLAKVATLTQQERQLAEVGLTLTQAEVREWEAAKAAAEYELKKAEINFNRAQRELDEATPIDYKIKSLLRDLAEAKVQTACAVLKAIKVKNSSYSAVAEAELAEALNVEKKASEAVEDAETAERAFSNSRRSMTDLVALREALLQSPLRRVFKNNDQFEKVSLDYSSSRVMLRLPKIKRETPLSGSSLEESTTNITSEENKGNSIEEPRKLSSFVEIIERVLAHKERKERKTIIEESEEGEEREGGRKDHLDSKEESLNEEEIMLLSEVGSEIQLPKITEPTEEDLIRWEARKKADELAKEAEQLAHEALEAESKGRRNSLRGDERSGRGSVVSIFSALSERFSVSSVQYNISGFHRLKSVDEEAIQAEEAWAQLARRADETRVTQGGTPYLYQCDLDAWAEADRRDHSVYEERQRCAEEEALALRMAKDWEANTERWEAMFEADLLTRELKNAETSFSKLLQTPKRQDPLWQREHQVISQKIEALKQSLQEAQKKWSSMADLEATVQSALQSQDSKLLEVAKEKLKKADRAVNELWQEVGDRYQSEENPSISFRRDQISRVTQATGAYKFDLLSKKSKDLLLCFEKTEAVLRTARMEYEKGNTLSGKAQMKSRAEAKALYDQVDQCEQEALTKYADVTEHDALKAARKKIPGAKEAWEYRVEKASAALKSVQQAVASIPPNNGRIKNSEDIWEDDSLRTIHKLTLVAEIDHKAFHVFQEEEARLLDIEKTWTIQLEAEKKAHQIKREAAAKSYFKGDYSAWLALSSEERRAYNSAIETLHQERAVAAEHKIQEALANVLHAVTQAEQAKKVWIGKARLQEETLEEAERTKATLEHLLLQLTFPIDRERDGAFVPLSYEVSLAETRKVELNDRLAKINPPTLKNAIKEAERVTLLAMVAQKTLCNIQKGNQKNPLPFFPVAIQYAQAASLAAEKVIAAYEGTSLGLSYWLSKRRMDVGYAQFKKNFWEHRVLDYEALKNEVIANESAKLAETVEGERSVPVWDEAIHFQKEAFLAKGKVIAAIEDAFPNIPEKLKKNWKEQLENMQRTRFFVAEKILALEDDKAYYLAQSELEKVSLMWSPKAEDWERVAQLITESVVTVEKQSAYFKNNQEFSQDFKLFVRSEEKNLRFALAKAVTGSNDEKEEAWNDVIRYCNQEIDKSNEIQERIRPQKDIILIGKFNLIKSEVRQEELKGYRAASLAMVAWEKANKALPQEKKEHWHWNRSIVLAEESAKVWEKAITLCGVHLTQVIGNEKTILINKLQFFKDQYDLWERKKASWMKHDDSEAIQKEN